MRMNSGKPGRHQTDKPNRQTPGIMPSGPVGDLGVIKLEIRMRPIAFVVSLLTFLFGATLGIWSDPALAFQPPSDSRLKAPVYRVSAALIQSFLADESIPSKIDSEGDVTLNFQAGNQ